RYSTTSHHPYPLSLHDALPIYHRVDQRQRETAPHFFTLLGKGREAFEHAVERAGTLAGSHRGTVERRKQARLFGHGRRQALSLQDRKSTRLNSSHVSISYAVFC